MPRGIVVDTSVFAYLTKAHSYSSFYSDVLSDMEIAVSFQTGAELLASGYGAPRQRRLETILARSALIPHTPVTSQWYAQALVARRNARRTRTYGGDAGDGDLWIISSTLEHGIPLMSHDAQQVALGRAMGLDVYTALPRLRASNPA